MGNKSIFSLITWFGADTSEFLRKTDQAKKRMKTFEKTMGTIKKAIAGAFAVGAISNFVKQSVKAYDVQAKAEAGLLNALEGRWDVQQRLIEQAGDIQKDSLFGDEQIIEQQKFLAALKLNEQQIRDTIKAAVELSAATGMTLESAVKNLAKTYGGLTGELGESLPEIKKFTSKQLEAGEAINWVNENLQGFAKTAAETGTGPLQKLTLAWGDFTEEIGRALVDTGALTEILDTLKEKITDLLSAWGHDEGRKNAEDYLDVIKDSKDPIKLLSQHIEYLKSQKEELDKQFDKQEYAKVFGQSLVWNKEKAEDLKTKINALQTEISILNREMESFSKKTYKPSGKSNGSSEEETQTNEFINIDFAQPISAMGQLVAEWDTASEKLNTINERIKESFTEFSNTLKASISDFVVSFSESLGQLAVNKDFDAFANNFLQSVGAFAKKMGAFMIAYGVSAMKIKTAFIDPIGAAVAGAALVGIGAAISSLASTTSSIGSGGGGGYSAGSYSAGSYATGNVSSGGGTDYKAQHLPELAFRGEDLYWTFKKVEYRKSKGY